MSDQVKKTDDEIRAEGKAFGLHHKMSIVNMEKAIEAKKTEKGPTGISGSEAKSIEAKLKFEEEVRERIKAERALTTERARIIAESESLCIPIDIPEVPTELDLARARRKLGIEKKAVKPSPETIAIEASKRGYYIFTNREQDDASHTVNLGGKYVIHLIPDQVHVLSEYHVKKWHQIAVTPVYGKVQTGVIPSGDTVGRPVEECRRTGSKQRWSFEYLGEAPQEADFGLVTDSKILKELTAPV